MPHPPAESAISELLGRLGTEDFEARFATSMTRAHFVGTPLGSVHASAVYNAMRHRDGLPQEHLDLKKAADRRRMIDLLEAAGFDVKPYSVLHPPQLGEEHPDRTAIRLMYGGPDQQGIWRFTDDPVVNVHSKEVGSYADEEPTNARPFEYRGEGLRGNQRLDAPGNQYLEAARLSRSAVRFWHTPRGGVPTFLMWCVVVDRYWSHGIDADRKEREEIVWVLMGVPDPHPDQWPGFVQDLIRSTHDPEDSQPVGRSLPNATYAELVGAKKTQTTQSAPKVRARISYQRRAWVRRAVLQRADGECESCRCTGMPPELLPTGDPILEVDHIKDLGLGGSDEPDNMIALCPNCHAAKTRGSNPSQWRRELLEIARRRHADALREASSSLNID